MGLLTVAGRGRILFLAMVTGTTNNGAIKTGIRNWRVPCPGGV